MANNEVRVEKQNDSLARSQSENNKTVQTLVSYVKSYYQGRKYALQSKASSYF